VFRNGILFPLNRSGIPVPAGHSAHVNLLRRGDTDAQISLDGPMPGRVIGQEREQLAEGC